MCAGPGVIAKSEAEYKNTVIRLLVKMRRSGEIPYDWLADNTRWMRKPKTHTSIQDALKHTVDYYRRDLWDDQDVYVEVWLEKDALAGVLMDVTRPWDVPLMVTRGYPSLSYMYEAAQTIAYQMKPCYLYYFGDRDPSGCDIDRALEQGLRDMAPDAEIHFERVAVTQEQIEELSLPTRPTKKTDSRSKNFKGESVEVDAIPPRELKAIAERCIAQHMDSDELRRLHRVEKAERETLKSFIKSLSRRTA